MDVASAYPNSDLSALSMTVIAVVMALALAVWLGLVFLADRKPRDEPFREPQERPADEDETREPKGAPLSGLRSE